MSTNSCGERQLSDGNYEDEIATSKIIFGLKDAVLVS